VSPILEAISNSVSVLPAAAPLAAPSISGQRGAGGFASTLATAQGLSSTSQAATSQTAAGEVEASNASGGLATGNTGAAPNGNVRMPAGGNAPPRKLLNPSPAIAASGLAAGSTVVPESIPTFIATAASQIIPAGPQPSLIPTSLVPSSLLQSSLPQASLPPTLTVASQAATPEVMSEAAQPSGWQTNASTAAEKSTTFEYSAPRPTTGTLSPSTSSAGTAGGLTDLATRGFFIPSQMSGQTSGQESGMVDTAIADNVQIPVFSPAAGGVVSGEGAVRLSAAGSGQWNGTESGLGSAKTPLPTEGTQPSVLFTATAQPASGAVLPEVPPVRQWNGAPGESAAPAEASLLANPQPSALSSVSEPLVTGSSSPGNLSLDSLPLGNLPQGNPTQANPLQGNQEGASPATGFGFAAAQSRLQADPPVSMASAPTLLADAGAGSEAVARVLPASGANLPIGPANSSDALPPGAVSQSELSAETGTGNPMTGVTDGAIPALPVLNPAAQLAAGRTSPQFAASRGTAAVTNPSMRRAGTGPGAPSSILPSALSPGSDSGDELAVASQTPFAVFFSSPGPGTESAASVLPKMILPATSSAIRDSHSAAPTGASPQTSGVQGGISQSSGSTSEGGASQNAGPQSLKDSLTGTESVSSAAGTSLHPAADQSAASTPLASSQAGAAPAPAAPASAGVALPLVQPPALSADSLPKPVQLPAAGNPAGTALAASENPAVVVPGPVQVAQLVNRVGQSEMRIGMNTSAFGSVEVRTVVHASDVGLVIGSEKGDLRGLLTNEMPAITNTLQQQNLRLNSVNFMQGFAFSNSGSGGGDSQQRSFVPMPASQSSESGSGSSESAADDAMESLPPGAWGGGGSGLSILA